MWQQCAGYLQGRGCSLNEQKGRISGSSPSTATVGAAQGDAVDAARGGGVRSYEDLKLERDSLKSENEDLKREIERLHANALKSGKTILIHVIYPSCRLCLYIFLRLDGY